MGKFTIVSEEAESTSSESGNATASTKENVGATSTENRLDEAFTLKTVQPRRRGRPPGSANKEKFAASVAENPANYTLWSQVLIGSVNTVAVTWLGNECAMEKREADMLEPPLSRMLARMPVSASQKMATFIDPMVMMIALGMWGNRIIKIQREKHGNSISQEEFNRAVGVSSPPVENVEPVRHPQYVANGSVIEPDLPRSKVEINPNGVPVAISSQMGEV